MPSTPPANQDARKTGRFAFRLRDIVAFLLWSYAFTKLFVFDVDVYVVRSIAPGAVWLLDLKLLITSAFLGFLWLFLGHKAFFSKLAYVAAYPLVLLFWYIPSRLWRQWPLAIICAPAIHAVLARARSTFVLYTLAATSTVTIVLSHDRRFVIPAMIGLGIFLASQLYLAIQQAHASSVFADLAVLTRRLQKSIETGSYDQGLPIAAQAQPPPMSWKGQEAVKDMPPLFLIHGLASAVAELVAVAARSRKYNLLLLLSWLQCVISAVLVFGLEYWALFRLSPTGFKGTTGDGFFQFVGFSLGILATSSVSQIVLVSETASMIGHFEVACSMAILIIALFAIVTAGRDSYREDARAFTEALYGAADALERRMIGIYEVTLDQMERVLLQDNAAFINFFRKARGLDELPVVQSTPPTPKKAEPTATGASATDPKGVS